VTASQETPSEPTEEIVIVKRKKRRVIVEEQEDTDELDQYDEIHG
jgi:ATP/maltotriose-dependent transcriptional regulator MalT